MTTATREKTIVLKAIDELGRRVTPADVASKTGLPLVQVTSSLNQIASETQGHMEVSNKGDIAYLFSPGFQNHYLAQGFKKFLEKVWSVAFSVGYFLLRISFGIMLILSMIIVVVLIMLLVIWISTRGNNDDDDSFGGFGGGFHLSFFDYLILRDILFATTYSSAPSSYSYDRPTIRKTDKSNFFFNCFSFLFGDGNPNLNVEERKWTMIAEVIRRNGGVATAELLAPYTGAKPDDEDAVLPVLVRFDGRPEVTDDGDIIYIFPSMQVTAKQHQLINLPSYLSEWTWKFSNVPPSQMTPVYLLAGMNFLGSWFLFAQAHAHYANPMMNFSGLINLLVLYGTLFLIVPLVRYLTLATVNTAIEERNSTRLTNARLLENPSDKLLKKLAQAQEMKVKTTLLREGDSIYTTEKDSLEQEFDASP